MARALPRLCASLWGAECSGPASGARRETDVLKGEEEAKEGVKEGWWEEGRKMKTREEKSGSTALGVDE